MKDNPIDKWGKGLKALNKIVNLYCRTANKDEKKLSLIKSSEIQIKITMRYPYRLTDGQKLNILITPNIGKNVQQNECKLVQPFVKQIKIEGK